MKNGEKGSLELNYKGDMEEYLSGYFDERIEILEWELKQHQKDTERCEKRIKELKRKLNSMDTWPQERNEISQEISYYEDRIRRNDVSEEPFYEMIGWLYEIKHEIMKID